MKFFTKPNMKWHFWNFFTVFKMLRLIMRNPESVNRHITDVIRIITNYTRQTNKVDLCVNLIRFIRFFRPNIPRPIFLHVKRFFQNLPLSPFHSFPFLHIPLVIQNLLIDATLPVAFFTCHMFTCSTFYFIWNILLLEYSFIVYILVWFYW